MLEHYEQSCAVDSLTKKCAGSPDECRKAMLGILGTELRTNCACKGTDYAQLYDCLGWQRLLWVNPCVGKVPIRFTRSIMKILVCLIGTDFLFQWNRKKTITLKDRRRLCLRTSTGAPTKFLFLFLLRERVTVSARTPKLKNRPCRRRTRSNRLFLESPCRR